MSENEGPVSGSVVNEPAKLSEARPSEQIKHGQRSVWELDRKLTKPETMFAQLAMDDFVLQSRSANLKCTNAECRKREEEINRLNKELNEVKRKLQESEKQGHKMTDFIHWLLNEKRGLEKKIKNFETEQVLEHDVTDGAKLLEQLKLKEEDERRNSENIKMDEIDNALKDVKTKMQTEKYPALLVVKYGMQSMPLHCVAIMPTTDDSEHVEIYDVQKNEQWNMNSNKVKSITEIELHKIDEKEAKAWELEYSSTASCKVNVRRNSDGLDGALTNAV